MCISIMFVLSDDKQCVIFYYKPLRFRASLGNMLHETLRDKSYRIIWGTNTTAGQSVDVILMTSIILSSVVILGSIESFSQP